MIFFISYFSTFRLCVKVFCVSLEEGFGGERQLTVGAQEDLSCPGYSTLCILGEKGENINKKTNDKSNF